MVLVLDVLPDVTFSTLQDPQKMDQGLRVWILQGPRPSTSAPVQAWRWPGGPERRPGARRVRLQDVSGFAQHQRPTI